MLANLSDPAVLIITGIALSISTLSLYISHVFLPAKMKEAYLKSITALAAAVETKDSGTVGHAMRVAELAVSIAKKLGITGNELERIQYAALLRDIGKAIIPQAILNKIEPLTPEEWKTVQKHSELGAEMVRAVPFLANTADYIVHHHEYWDGTGYPDGQKGEGIPLGSRILAIASDYDAMTSQRPYHPRALEPEEAVEEIRMDSGSKYDPTVVDAFLEVVNGHMTSLEKVKAA